MRMSEELMVHYCAPTLAGLKTGSMFSCEVEDKAALTRGLVAYNRILVPRGLRAVPLRFSDRRALIYVFRPDRLAHDLAGEAAKGILSERQYPVGQAERCTAELARRVQSSADFPHEVGLFLGYPPEDVAGFIENGSHGAKCVGAWKVYGDEKQARKTFRRYAACTRAYRRAYGRRAALEELICTDRPGNGADRARTVRR